MLNYIQAELYRITHKRSVIVYYGILMVLFAAITLISYAQGGLTTEDYFQVGVMIMSTGLFLYFIGIHTFITVYADDLSANALSNVFSVGLSKTAFILAKMIVGLIVLVTAFVLCGSFYVLLHWLLIGSMSWTSFEILLNFALVQLIAIWAFMSVSSIVAYATQKSTISITFYIMLVAQAFYAIIYLLSLVLDFFQTVLDYTMTASLVNALQILNQDGSIDPEAMMILGAYIIAGLAGAIVIVRKQEINT